MAELPPVEFPEPSYRRLLSGSARGLYPASARALLSLASVPYSLAVRTRNSLYDHRPRSAFRPAVPVISVGNITVGGTGKTPFVEQHLAQRLSAAGRRVALLSQGYKSDPSTGDNDETRLLARHLPPEVVQLASPNRVASSRLAVSSHHSNVILLDDGFQHRRIVRDLDIVLIDALEPFGFERLLPRGLLREPLSGLRRAHLIVITRTDLVGPIQTRALESRIERLAPGVPVIHATFPLVDLRTPTGQGQAKLDHLSGKRAFSFCGIGNPASFALTLKCAGITPVGWRVFPDHHHYSPDDLPALGDLARRWGADVFLTTEKDAVKLLPGWSWPLPVWYATARTVIAQGERLLDELLARTLAAPSKTS